MDSQKKEGAPDKQPADQQDKPLGRGLEQISHLFLTQRAQHPQSHARPTNVQTVLLQPKAITKDQLVAAAKANPDSIEEGLRILDMFVQCHPHSDIDLLAVNRTNQLAAIDFETGLDDGIVLRALGHYDWIRHNVINIRRMYSSQALDGTQPRLFVIAPKFSSLALHAAPPLAQLQIHWIRYQVFDTGSTTGISFETIA